MQCSLRNVALRRSTTLPAQSKSHAISQLCCHRRERVGTTAVTLATLVDTHDRGPEAISQSLVHRALREVFSVGRVVLRTSARLKDPQTSNPKPRSVRRGLTAFVSPTVRVVASV